METTVQDTSVWDQNPLTSGSGHECMKTTAWDTSVWKQRLGTRVYGNNGSGHEYMESESTEV